MEERSMAKSKTKSYDFDVLLQRDVVRVYTDNTGRLILELSDGHKITEAPCYVLEVGPVATDGTFTVVYRPIP